MTGAENYAEALRLLSISADHAHDDSRYYVGEAAASLMAAQVHATLALAAAVERQTRHAHGVDSVGYS